MSYTPRPTLLKRVLNIRNVARVNSGGKVRSVSALVVIGDMNGSAGYGSGRGADVTAAVAKASRQAKERMVLFPRLDNRTILNNVDCQFHAVNLKMWTAQPGHGIVANNYVHEICRCIGISDLAAKVQGSRNPMNVIKATFEALKMQKNPQAVAKARGKKLVDIERAYYGTTL